MASRLTIRLDKATSERIARLAKRRRLSVSELVRHAIEEFLRREATSARPYELMKDLIGVVRGGRANRSEGTGRQFTAMLKARRPHS